MNYKIKKISPNYKLFYQDDIFINLIEDIIDILLRDKRKTKDMKLIKERLTPSKDGKKRNVEVYKYIYNSEVYYIKHFYQRRISKRILRMFSGPQGLKNFKKALIMQENNIPCALPIGCITYKNNFFDVDSIYISKGVEGLNILETLIARGGKNKIDISHRLSAAHQLGKICAQLVNINFLHKDPNPQNFICSGYKKPKITIIDFENIFKVSYLPLWQVKHFLARTSAKFYVWFVKNNIAPPTSEEKIIFLKHFFANLERDVEIKEFMDGVNKLIVKKILSRADKSVLEYDEKMLDLMNRKKNL